MKHIFIVNPYAGSISSYDKIKRELTPYMDSYDIEIYKTIKEKDATSFVINYCENHSNENFRFYACGGDGTLNEIINGVYKYPNASISLYPCGSGNDFVKSLGDIENFNNLDLLLEAKDKKIDLIKINDDKFCINVCNFGFDACVAKHANKVKAKRGKHAYLKGIIKAVFCAMKNYVTVEVEGEVLNPEGHMLLTTLANGAYVGGKYKCAPNYILDDGILEVCLIKTTSIFNFLKLIKEYEKGNHLTNKKFKKLTKYRRAKKIKLYADKNFDICLDGEIINGNYFEVEVLNKVINFAVPEVKNA